MRTRANNWFDTKTQAVLYGIDVWHEGQWCHAAEDGQPLLFRSQAERDAKRQEIRRRTDIASAEP